MQKTSIANTNGELADPVALISSGEEDSAFETLAANLAEISKFKGVKGYILRSNSSAIIDLTEQDKIIEYAVLASQLCESGFEMAKQFDLGETESVLVEGKYVKVLCITIGENRISVFLEKFATYAWIKKRILL